jgi:hypothetical protein
MKILRRVGIVLAVLVVAGAVWIWWNRPGHADMAAYVPSDAMAYFEADSLPAITSAMTATDAWQALAPAAGIRPIVAESGWIARLMSWTGIGPAESIVFSRAQVAVVVLGMDAAAGEDALHVRPRYGLVIESHTGQSRTLSALESQIGKFATRAYVNPSVDRKSIDGVEWITWTAPAQDRRIVIAVMGSLAIVANDESVVRACLDAKRGARPNLAANPALREMRQRMQGSGALAFGYIAPAGVARLYDLYAPPYAAQIADDPERQGMALKIGAEIARKSLGAIGWSARLTGGRIEDRYYISLDPLAAQALAPGLVPQAELRTPENELLPRATYSLTHYNLADPSAAWIAFNQAMAAKMDGGLAMAIPIMSARLLESYGIDDPGTFFRATDGQLVTARIEDEPGATVAIFTVKDERVIRAAVMKRMGANARKERIVDQDVIVSADERRGAAVFIGNLLLIGSRERIRSCLESKVGGRSITSAAGYTKALASIDRAAVPVTYSLIADAAASRELILAVSSRPSLREREPDVEKLTAALEQLPYASVETRVVEGGLDRRTRSGFGQFGAIAARFAGGR